MRHKLWRLRVLQSCHLPCNRSMEIDGEPAEPSTSTFSLYITEVVRTAQGQHGIKYQDFARYRLLLLLSTLKQAANRHPHVDFAGSIARNASAACTKRSSSRTDDSVIRSGSLTLWPQKS